MPKKIPIRIYRIRGDVQNALGSLASKPSRSDSSYLQGVTAADITPQGTIILPPDSIPAFTSILPNGEYPVEDRFGEPHVLIDAAAYYIRLVDPPTSSGEVLESFEFYVNPQRVAPAYKKLITETRTRGGWEVQHWGSELTSVRVEGKSGGMNRVTRSQSAEVPGGIGQSLRSDESVMDSEAWKRLVDLKRFYDQDHETKNQEELIMLAMNYFDRYYVGYFADFTGPDADAMNPYQINYAFTFRVQQELSAEVA